MARPTDYLNANGGTPSNANGNGQDDDGNVTIGARQSKFQLGFCPRGAAEGIAIEYSGLMYQTFSMNWTRITLHYVTHEVVIEGQELKGLLSQIMDHTAKWVRINDFEITGIRVEARKD